MPRRLATALLALPFAVPSASLAQSADDRAAVRQAVLDKTASAKVVAHWGVDYMHLAKVDGRWMIRNILCQSPPPSE